MHHKIKDIILFKEATCKCVPYPGQFSLLFFFLFASFLPLLLKKQKNSCISIKARSIWQVNQNTNMANKARPHYHICCFGISKLEGIAFLKLLYIAFLKVVSFNIKMPEVCGLVARYFQICFQSKHLELLQQHDEHE